MAAKCRHCKWRDQVLNDYPRQCPVCAKPVQYAESLDRFIHLDGSANAACWVACTRGEVAS